MIFVIVPRDYDSVKCLGKNYKNIINDQFISEIYVTFFTYLHIERESILKSHFLWVFVNFLLKYCNTYFLQKFNIWQLFDILIFCVDRGIMYGCAVSSCEFDKWITFTFNIFIYRVHKTAISTKSKLYLHCNSAVSKLKKFQQSWNRRK